MENGLESWGEGRIHVTIRVSGVRAQIFDFLSTKMFIIIW